MKLHFFFDFKGDVELVDHVTSQTEEINKTFVNSFQYEYHDHNEASYFNLTVEWPGEGEVILRRLYNDITSRTKDHSAYAQIEHMKYLFGKKELRDVINSVEFMRFYFDCAPDVSNLFYIF